MPRRFTRTEDSNLVKLRTQEKAKLWSRFQYSIVESIYKDKFFALFGSRCFKCGYPPPLEIDHHVPLVLGGHLVPGNLVALCSRCNGIKLDRHPEDFYSASELERLAPLLELQKPFFESFVFDYEAWERDKTGYLVSLGLHPSEAWAVFNDPSHRYFMGKYPEPGPSAETEIDDAYALIRPTLNDYKTELKVLLALAKPLGYMSEETWEALLQFFKNQDHTLSHEHEQLLRRYVKSWGTVDEIGFQVHCDCLDSSPEHQHICDDILSAATAIVSTQPSDVCKVRLEMLRQRLIGQ